MALTSLRNEFFEKQEINQEYYITNRKFVLVRPPIKETRYFFPQLRN